jgi:hypothetical protein
MRTAVRFGGALVAITITIASAGCGPQDEQGVGGGEDVAAVDEALVWDGNAYRRLKDAADLQGLSIGYGVGPAGSGRRAQDADDWYRMNDEFSGMQLATKDDGSDFVMEEIWLQPTPGVPGNKYNWAQIDAALASAPLTVSINNGTTRTSRPFEIYSSPVLFAQHFCTKQLALARLGKCPADDPDCVAVCTAYNKAGVPSWIRDPSPATNPLGAPRPTITRPMLQTYHWLFIKDFVARYSSGTHTAGRKIKAFQLTNELVSVGKDFWYEHAFKGTYADETQDLANYFCTMAKAAHEGAPAAQVFVNDWDNDNGLVAGTNPRAVKFFNAVKLAQKGLSCPGGLDGVGFQTHHRMRDDYDKLGAGHARKGWWNDATSTLDTQKYYDDVKGSIRKYADLGLDIYMTEGGIALQQPTCGGTNGTTVLHPGSYASGMCPFSQRTAVIRDSEKEQQRIMFRNMFRAFRSGAISTTKGNRLKYLSVWGALDRNDCHDAGGCLWDLYNGQKPAYDGVYQQLKETMYPTTPKYP